MITEEQAQQAREILRQYKAQKRQEKLVDSGKYDPLPKEKWGVHEHHCCFDHCCKYGYPNCPVELGLTKALYPCEECFTPLSY